MSDDGHPLIGEECYYEDFTLMGSSIMAFDWQL